MILWLLESVVCVKGDRSGFFVDGWDCLLTDGAEIAIIPLTK